MTGLIHIYCGDGKGKTTAATGLAVRAAGNGMQVLFARFLKQENSCELKILDEISNIEVIHLDKKFGFYNMLDEFKKSELKEIYHALWNEIKSKIRMGNYQLLVVDEIMAACNYGIINWGEVIEFLKQKPEGLEVVMTGRNPTKELIEIADYVSEIIKIKHPFDQNIGARPGIEY